MAGPTDTELQKLRDDNDKLREKIADAESKRSEHEAEINLSIEYTGLLTENARLTGQLASAQEAAKASSVKAGASGVLAVLKNELAQAEVVSKAKPGPVDTNANVTTENGGNN